jgi:diguanylate cyclase (GGDEF)-like protein
MRVYNALSRAFPRSYRAKLLAVVLCCTLLPMLALVAWLLANNGEDPGRLLWGTTLGLAATLGGTLLSLLLIYHLLQPLRRAADALDAYYRELQLPRLPMGGADEMGRLLRGIHRCLHGIDAGRQELERHALEDSLTRGLNRRGCEQALARSVETATRCGDPFVLFVVDLDNLKQINDEHGHAAGDAALAAVVETARACSLGKQDWIGRWGGDEFLVGVHDSAASAQDKVRSWLKVLAHPGGRLMPVLVSAGCAQWLPGQDALQLYRQADAAMYEAKFSGGHRLVCHCEEAVAALAAVHPMRA